MADDILNINGKLIRLRDNGDGTWSWATALTGSSLRGGDGAKTFVRSGSLAAATSEILFSAAAGKAFVLEFLEFASDSDVDTYLAIKVRDETGTLIYVPNASASGGSVSNAVYAFSVRTNGSGLFELVKDAAGTYKFVMRANAKLWFPNGGEIAVGNSNATTAKNVACVALIRKVVA